MYHIGLIQKATHKPDLFESYTRYYLGEGMWTGLSHQIDEQKPLLMSLHFTEGSPHHWRQSRSLSKCWCIWIGNCSYRISGRSAVLFWATGTSTHQEFFLSSWTVILFSKKKISFGKLFSIFFPYNKNSEFSWWPSRYISQNGYSGPEHTFHSLLNTRTIQDCYGPTSNVVIKIKWNVFGMHRS